MLVSGADMDTGHHIDILTPVIILKNGIAENIITCAAMVSLQTLIRIGQHSYLIRSIGATEITTKHTY